jgi:ATP-dependent RNA helicase RhlE
MLFKDLLLIEPLLRALETEGTLPPIQEQAIPVSSAAIFGCAQTTVKLPLLP